MIRKVINKFGLKDKGDFYVLIICLVVLGPGSLILLSWTLIPFETYGTNFVSNFLDIIFGKPPHFIIFIYIMISTLCAIIWWGMIILEALTKKN